MSTIEDDVSSVYGEMQAWRRDFHQHPELSHQEVRTSGIVAQLLKSFGLEVTENIGGDHGVVGLLRGAKSGRTIGLRADMDALPVKEANDFAYKSQTDGVMHACGHDGHTAMLLGVAKLLARQRSELHGTVKFIFQPAEESIGSSGAEAMVKAGVLDNPKVDAIFMLHVFPYSPAGTIQLSLGPMCAAADRVAIRVQGKGGHGSQPSKAVDALLAASQIVVGLESAAKRHIDVFDPAVLTIGKLHAGTAANIIADSAELEGSVRSYSEEARTLMESAVRDIADGAARMYGATAIVDYTQLIPAVINDRSLAEAARKACEQSLGAEAVTVIDKPVMGSEDFSFYLKAGVPGVMLALGGGISGRQPFPNHSPNFDWDEKAMIGGATALMAITRDFLKD